MKRTLIAPLFVAIGYCAVYHLGQPFVTRSSSLSHLWATAFYPLRLIQFRQLYSGILIERGTIEQDISGDWGLTYAAPKKDPRNGTLTQGILFRVPAHLSATVANAKGKLVDVAIRKELDSQSFNGANFVLNSITVSASQ
ncbi:MAG: hypothetical protein ABJF10_29150 [Chthoniobacter sp.]|uniref:hypothetical protein n=1 Tax=Chthoniobacter sp. TaxID=2510640 RepID=UPI0032A94B72